MRRRVNGQHLVDEQSNRELPGNGSRICSDVAGEAVYCDLIPKVPFSSGLKANLGTTMALSSIASTTESP